MNEPVKVLICSNTAWSLVNFRSGLIKALLHKGLDVAAVAPEDGYAPRLAELGCRYIPLAMDNKGTNPGSDLLLLTRFYSLLRRERPSVFLGYTVKPNVYGSMAAHFLGIPVINNVAGLGTVFVRESWLSRIVRLLYRLAFSRSHKVFFQNSDDRKLFVGAGMVLDRLSDQVPGSGVNLSHFTVAPVPPLVGRPFRFLLPARMLWDKGVAEYIEAAEQVHRRFPNTEFGLVGFLDVLNPGAISRRQMDAWTKKGFINYFGEVADVRPYLAAADCVVLPSYYPEGVPRALLEAAATGRPIITTNAVGCRDAVEGGITGYLVQARDPKDLAEKMGKMMVITPEERAAMGKLGRAKMMRDFDEKLVIDRYIDAIDQVVNGFASRAR